MSERLVCELFQLAWLLFCSWTPRPLNSWRCSWLRLFGAVIPGKAIIAAGARIEVPWRLRVGPSGTIGDRAYIYNLAQVNVGENATVAQEAFICTGTHKLDDASLPLQTAPIDIGQQAFLGARCFILPGLTIGEGAVVGACSVITRDVEPWSIYAGNPAKRIGERVIIK